ncbi:MAG: cell division protein ZapA [Negativicutes bacterium]|nr:cell division protein ZapA [Negativicutes bacterium]
MNAVKVMIGGAEYLLKGDKDEDFVRSLAAMVDERFTSIRSRNSRLSNMQAMVLTALNLAEELVKSRGDYEKLVVMIEPAKKPVEKRSIRAARRISRGQQT